MVPILSCLKFNFWDIYLSRNNGFTQFAYRPGLQSAGPNKTQMMFFDEHLLKHFPRIIVEPNL